MAYPRKPTVLFVLACSFIHIDFIQSRLSKNLKTQALLYFLKFTICYKDNVSSIKNPGLRDSHKCIFLIGLEERIQQIQINLLHNLNVSLKLVMILGWEPKFTTQSTVFPSSDSFHTTIFDLALAPIRFWSSIFPLSLIRFLQVDDGCA